jgi:hypothetical protein
MSWHGIYIDPAIKLERRARWRLHRDAWKLWFKDPLNSTLYGAGLVFSILVFMILPDVMSGLLGNDSWYFSVGALIVYLVLLFVLMLIMRRFRFASCVYAELRKRGFDVCLRCGYLLVDLDDSVGHCPECGCSRTPLD